MLKDPQSPRYAVRRTHRTYTPQFKAQLIAACQQPGASIAALALQHGMNANVLHRWLKEWRQGLHRLPAPTIAAAAQPAAFVPIALNCAPSPSSDPAPTASPTLADHIRLQCQRQDTSVTVHWPLCAAAECAQLLRELLR